MSNETKALTAEEIRARTPTQLEELERMADVCGQVDPWAKIAAAAVGALRAERARAEKAEEALREVEAHLDAWANAPSGSGRETAAAICARGRVRRALGRIDT